MQRRRLLKILGSLPLATSLPFEPSISKKFENQSTDEESIDLVIYDATPGGVACAVRAAREGLKVLIINHSQHLGGIFSCGLSTMDTLYNGSRSPIYDEYRFMIYDYYRSKYGTKSDQYERTNPGFPKTRYEAHIAEMLIGQLIEKEKNITVIKGYYPVEVIKENRKIKSVKFMEVWGEDELLVHGNFFADCSYEGDLMAVTGVKYRIGRESREEFGEEYAGIAWVKRGDDVKPEIDASAVKVSHRMNLYRYNGYIKLILPESTGEKHPAIQAFNLRTILTNDPENKIFPKKPKNYDREYINSTYREHITRVAGMTVPNSKFCWNHPEVVGEQNNYVTGDWNERKRVTNKHREDTLSLLYFLQNDSSVPEKWQNRWKELGLPKDEFQENGNLPYELYVREARRLAGPIVFTENDARLAPGLKRAPVHGDSISITEWFLDSHACTKQMIDKTSLQEGEVMLKEETFPGQVPFRTLFSDDLDNFIVPVCLSASHIGWGAIRLEPTWMSIGESAAYAVNMAIENNLSIQKIESDKLIRLLANKRIMLSFFNDVEGREYSCWYPAIQYLGTQGFFSTYDAKPMEKLGHTLAETWISLIAKPKRNLNRTDRARKIMDLEESSAKPITVSQFASKLEKVVSSKNSQNLTIHGLVEKLGLKPGSEITRGEASMLIFEATT